MKAVPPKSHVELVDGWDRLAAERHRQIVSGDDISFRHVIEPAALSLLKDCDKSLVVEIGSGTGQFTNRLAAISGQVLAVEPSRVSLHLARKTCSANNNVMFFDRSLECVTDRLVNFDVTSAVAVMSLMTAPDLPAVAESLDAILPSNAGFVAILTHPWFWPQYWGYHDKQWFHYEKEIFIEAAFTISRRSTEILTTHIHRPLEQYLSTFSQNGFHLETMIEPFPDAKTQDLYPEPWRFPRFVGLKWVKAPTQPVGHRFENE